jgi:hypothetical protein
MASGKSQETLRIPDLAKYQKALKDLGASNKEMGEATFKAGSVTVAAIRGIMLPMKKSGKLLSTVKAGKQGTKVVITIGNNTTAKYAGLQNYGSRLKNVPAKFFMQMGIRRTRDFVLEIYLTELQKMINKYERKSKS